MIAEDRLVAWLVMVEFQMASGHEVSLPQAVVDALLQRGWLEPVLSEPDEDGEVEGELHFSSEARAQADLWSPEFGVELSFEVEGGA